MSQEFFDAIRAGDLVTVVKLLTADPSLAHATNAEQYSAFHLAAECDDVKIGLLLLQAGADPKCRLAGSKHTPLSWAVTTKSFHFAKAMVAAGIQPDLFCAAGIGLLDEVKSCFDASGNVLPYRLDTGSSRVAADGSRLPCPPTIRSEQVADALYIAARNGRVEVAEYLLTQQPDLQFKAYLGAGLLHWAYFGNSPVIIQRLIDVGLSETEKDPSHGYTPREFGIRIPHEWGLRHLVTAQLARDPSLASLLSG
jgi:ankyrin repeat protein